MANDILWTISIIAQTDEQHDWEYSTLVDDINNNRHEKLRYVIFRYDQDNRNITFWEANTKQELQPQIKNVLAEFFAGEILSVPSDYHMLITWGHGAGLGFFHYDRSAGTKTRNNSLFGITDDKEKDDYKKNKRKINIKNVHHSILLSNLSTKFGSKNRDEFRKTNSFHPDNIKEFNFSTDILLAEDFADILEETFGNPNLTKNGTEKVNVFIANNCWMNMFEVGWALREHVDVYAAPQTVVPFAGFNYHKLFKSLPTIDYSGTKAPTAPWVIARNITDNFLLKYTDTDIDEKYFKKTYGKYKNFGDQFSQEKADSDVRQMAISVNHLECYNEINNLINELCRHLIRKLNTQDRYFLQRIDTARSYCGDFTQEGVSFIDFTNFFCELIKGFQTNEADELKELYRKFFFLKENAQLSILNPGELFRFMPTDFYSQSPQMFSIFFPSRTARSDTTKQFLYLYFD